MALSKLIRITTVPVSLKVLLKGQLEFMSMFYDVIGISSSGTELFEVANQGIKVIPIEMSRRISPIQDIKSLWLLYKTFKKEKPLIVHTHTPKAGTVGMLAARLAGVPIRLHTIAGLPLLESKGGKRFLLDNVERLTYSCATMIYPNSKGLYDIILRNKYTNEFKLKVIGPGSTNGINTKYFSDTQITSEIKAELKEKLKIRESDFLFIFVGRLVKDKGLDELLTAFDYLARSNNRLKLLLVGRFEKNLDPLSAKSLEILKKNTSIIEVGHQKDVRPYFAISDALVFPSYREGFPNVVMQAGAMGLPSIVTDINGCNEIIIHGKNGVVVPPKDVKALAEAMELFSSNYKILASMRSISRNLIVSRYEQQEVWNAVLNEYRVLEHKTSNLK